ncbi:CidA/LrgA family protein [Hahella sp. SMD15-11]|uniref:CidA/LrgA family protein n=1 Tax=Thermohahella caldifontis TaxID=3142973 RepID=A0AB39UZL4_9GAMM
MTRYLIHLSVLLSFQWAGAFISARLPFPLPGPVAGMLLLLAALFLIGDQRSLHLRHTSKGLIQLLPLWFIPAGAGFVSMAAPLAQYGWSLGGVVLGSTVLTFLATLLISQWLTAGESGHDTR